MLTLFKKRQLLPILVLLGFLLSSYLVGYLLNVCLPEAQNIRNLQSWKLVVGELYLGVLVLGAFAVVGGCLYHVIRKVGRK